MSILRIIKKYNVEPILFFYYTAQILYTPTPLTKLISDKFCINKYKLSADDFCYDIQKYAETEDAIDIARDTADYLMYGSFITSFPSLFAALFLGPWLDQHKIAPKIVLLSTVTAGLFEATCLLLNVVFFDAPVQLMLLPPVLNGITGGEMIFMTACFVYAMKATPLEERTFRFVIIVLPNPIAQLLSSFILPLEPHFKDQIRNYLPLLLLAISSYLLGLFFVIFFVGEVQEIISPEDTILKRASVRTSIQPLSSEYLAIKRPNPVEPSIQYVNKAFEVDMNAEPVEHKENRVSFDLGKAGNYHQDDNNNTLGSNQHKPRALSVQSTLSVQDENLSKAEIFRSLFRMNNAIEIFRGIFKRREEKAHILLWLTITIYFVFLCNSNGMPLILTLFVEKAYQWEVKTFQMFESAGALLNGVAITLVVSYLHKIKMDDTKIIGIGMTSLFLMCFFRGIILHPAGLFLSYFFGSIFLCGLVGCRGFVSKFIPENELGTVLSSLSLVYALSPIFASFLYTKVYSLTLESYAGTAFLVGAGIIVCDFVLLIVLHFQYLKFNARIQRKKFPTI